MTNIFIFHGCNGSPDANWFPWLKRELEARGHSVIVPQFPIMHDQKLDNWLSVMEQYKDRLEDSILIGHSLGATFILDLLESFGIKVRSAYLIGGFIGKLGPDFDVFNSTFAEKDFDWDRIKQACGSFHVMASDDDPYVPLSKAYELGESLGVSPIVLEGQGHFMFFEFRYLLDGLKRI
ncbi:alpha/beta hydrolase [Candidatus Woesearchaeota archaeon]|nr:alpha/beta hydrolase [Candidatus Woesearchaeota archaeon]